MANFIDDRRYTLTRAEILIQLNIKGGQSVTELHNCSGIARAVVSRVVFNLAEFGLAERDGYNWYLTSAGKEEVTRAEAVMHKKLAKLRSAVERYESSIDRIEKYRQADAASIR